MKVSKKMLFLVVLLLAMTSCTDATIANWKSLGDKHEIIMYNGGILVAKFISTGKVTSISDGDGWQFMDSETGKLVRVGGDVIIKVID